MTMRGTRRATFAPRLRAREAICGLFVRTPRHEIVELLGSTALDFIVLDAEHAPFDRTSLDTCLLAAMAADLPALVRIPEARSPFLAAALDLGASGVLVPHVDDAATAAAVARAARYGGPDSRGLSLSTRAAGYGRRSYEEHLAKANAEILVICQIETPAAVTAASSIIAQDGVDGLFLGRFDLAATSGILPSDPSLDEAAAAMIAAAQTCAKPAGLIVGDVEGARAARAGGASIFVLGIEQAILRAEVSSRLQALRPAFEAT
ncbi:MAG TPA: aldolase/citrate lyase family protein [Stellaceae bacterium]|nr:aldolase/citrate lyase family protein [Stellaceae bacterium]